MFESNYGRIETLGESIAPSSQRGLNRTMVGLKPEPGAHLQQNAQGLNRTMVGLKPSCSLLVRTLRLEFESNYGRIETLLRRRASPQQQRLNRTMVGLKPVCVSSTPSADKV